MTTWLSELKDVSPDIARKLVDTLFQQTGTLIVGGAVFAVLGLIGYLGTGSAYYLAGSGASAAVCAARLGLNLYYARARDTAPPEAWARRALAGAWSCGACWGGWNLAIVYDPDRTLLIGIIATLCASVIGAAVRNCGVPAVACGSIFLTLVPMTAAFALTGNFYMSFFAVSSGLHILAALWLTRFVHAQALRLLLQDEEKTKLLQGLEAAKQELELVNAHLDTLAATDALTGIANRRSFDLETEREWLRASREARPIALLMLDFDHFKKYNDRYGHQTGDACLRDVAATVRRAARRAGDVVARYGGEEFAVVLPGTSLGDAAEIGAEIMRAVAARAIPHDASDLGYVTVSAGAASLVPRPGTTVGALIKRADAALYAAKRGGRNRVHMAEDTRSRAYPALA